MEERRQPSFDPDAAARTIAERDLPDLKTPVIDVENLERQAQMDELIRRESGSTKADEDARTVGRKIAEHFKKLPKGRDLF